MFDYGAISWLPLTAGLTVVGLALSWLAWRRSGVGAGLRGVSLSLLPLAAYLTGLLELIWRVATACVDWVLHLAFSPAVWLGIALLGVSVVLFGVSSRLRARRPVTAGASGGRAKRAVTAETGRQAATAATSDDDDFSDIEQLLRRRGIS